MTVTNEVGTLLGFAKKAGKLFAGESAVKNAISKKSAFLVIMAEDIAEKRKEYWEKSCHYAGIKVIQLGTKKDYGRILGLSDRGILGVADSKMALAIMDKAKGI